MRVTSLSLLSLRSLAMKRSSKSSCISRNPTQITQPIRIKIYIVDTIQI